MTVYLRSGQIAFGQTDTIDTSPMRHRRSQSSIRDAEGGCRGHHVFFQVLNSFSAGAPLRALLEEFTTLPQTSYRLGMGTPPLRPGLRSGRYWRSLRRSPRPPIGWGWGHPLLIPFPSTPASSASRSRLLRRLGCQLVTSCQAAQQKSMATPMPCGGFPLPIRSTRELDRPDRPNSPTKLDHCLDGLLCDLFPTESAGVWSSDRVAPRSS